MRAAFVLVLVAACYAPKPEARCSVQCTEAGGCPSGLQCIAGICRTNASDCSTLRDGAIDADIDSDGDSVLDGDDNCDAVPNMNQRNHDGDLSGDACDPCPHLAAARADLDPDGDGLGDGCDPNPTTPGDALVEFHGFYGDALTNWNAYPPLGSAGSWVAMGGAMRLESNQVPKAFLEAPNTDTDVFVMTRIFGVGQVAGTVDHYIGVSVRRATNTHHECRLHVPTGGVSYAEHEVATDNEQTMQMTGVWNGPLIGQWTVITDRVIGSEVDCTAVQEQTNGSGQVKHDLTPVRGGRIAVVAELVSIDVDYIFIARGRL